MMLRWIASAVAAVSACAPKTHPVTIAEPVIAAAEATPPQAYVLRPGDVVEVTVFSAPELSRRAKIMPDGELRLPLAGAIPASGKTLDELRDDISDRLAPELWDPVVEVSVAGAGMRGAPVGLD